MPMYEKGEVRIHYEEAGSGFPLLIIPGGGLNSTIEGLRPTRSTHWPSSATTSGSSPPICATPRADNLPGRSKLTGRGTPIPMTISG